MLRFADVFNDGRTGGFRITFPMVGQAIAEFEMALTFANAPIDRFARGDGDAMTRPQKRGAVLFFGKANFVICHAVGGPSNEMFSDFKNHVLGVPQLVPAFGQGTGNVTFDGPGGDEDLGAEQITGDPADRYEFRTSPLRNVALQPAVFNNGAFTRLDEAIRHHLDVVQSARTCNPAAAGVDVDLTVRVGPINSTELIGIYNDRQTVIDDGVSRRLTLKKGPQHRPRRNRERWRRHRLLRALPRRGNRAVREITVRLMER